MGWGGDGLHAIYQDCVWIYVNVYLEIKYSRTNRIYCKVNRCSVKHRMNREN